MKLFILALAPAIIVALYIYIRDRYEKEPLRLLLIGLIYGVIMTAPIVKLENVLMLYMPKDASGIAEAFYTSFFVAALAEEGVKYLILFFLVWRNPQFNERFDGIVYAVFLSLGFAGVENVMYVFNPTLGGFETAIVRAVLSVPAHALFGTMMGYYFALAKFVPERRNKYIAFAFLLPFIMHGLFDFMLLADALIFSIIFVPFVVLLWVNGLKQMKRHLAKSPFAKKNCDQTAML